MNINKKQEYAIIVAGGKGTRMNSKVPKQFLLLNNLPVLMHTINAFCVYSHTIQIVLVLPENDIKKWNDLVVQYNFKIKVQIVKGGNSRFQSVKNGLESINSDNGLVAIHDGVRPLINPETILKSFKIAAKEQSAVAAVALKESIRKVNQSETLALDRTNYSLIQTPQTFSIVLIKKAYKQTEDVMFTDDASVVEKAGNKITLFEGSYDNIKITTSEDLLIAQALLNNRQ